MYPVDASSSAVRRRDSGVDDGDDAAWFHRPKLRLQGAVIMLCLACEIENLKTCVRICEHM